MPPRLPTAPAPSSFPVGYPLPLPGLGPRVVNTEWRQMTARAHTPELTSPSAPMPSIATLGASIRDNLSCLKRDWDTAVRTVPPEMVRDQLSEDYGAIIRLSEAVSAHQDPDLLSIDELIEKFDKAIRIISGARDISIGTFTTIGAQRHVADAEKLSPKAKAAFDALSHLKNALDTIVFTLSAKQNLEDRRQALKNPMTLQSLERSRGELANALEVTAELLNKTEPLINRCLAKAQAAIPAEKRRWKTKIAILTTFLIITVALGVASTLAPPLLPAIAGLALGLKLATTGMGVITALNGIFNVFGYARNRGWSKLSAQITAVKNLNDAINRGFDARNGVLRSNETTAIQREVGRVRRDVAAAMHKHQLINQKLKELSDTQSETLVAGQNTRL